MISKFIGVGVLCREFGNYNGVMEVIAGLNMHAVGRLSKTWAVRQQLHLIHVTYPIPASTSDSA